MPLSAVPVRLLSAGLCAALLLSGCTDEPAEPEAYPLPPVSEFSPGTCELVAQDVLALGRAARRLGPGPVPEDAVLTELTDAQKALQTVAGTAEPELMPLLDAVVTRAGLVRIAADSERYTPETSEPLQESYAALVAGCTGDGPPPAAPASATATATTG